MNKVFENDLRFFFSDFAEEGENISINKKFTYVFGYSVDEGMEIAKFYTIYVKTDTYKNFLRNQYVKINQSQENLRIVKIVRYDDFVSEITLSDQSIKWGAS